ncbi:MAG: flagellar motor protein MotB [Magnetovibrio sp.]|nr:flagellar motor protein MotB [Magnetovibrio sp.]
MNDMDGQIKPVEAGVDSTIALFLGLYLVVLAFFILLVSISSIEKTKSSKVMDSLSSTFTSLLPPSADLTTFTAKDGDIIAGQEFQQQVTGIYATVLGVDKVEIVQPGKQMRLLLKADSLFFDGEARIRPAIYPLLDRTVASLSNRPRGLRFDLEFMIGTPPSEDGKTMPVKQTLEVERAGAFARAMNERGIPPDSLSIGMRPGHLGEIVIYFYTRDIEATRLRFETKKK